MRIQHWVEGILNTVEHVFESIEEAMTHSSSHTSNHATTGEAFIIKIYNEAGEIVHHVTSSPSTPTYA